METLLILYVTILSIISLILMGVDKSRAKHHQWRISEKTLLTVAIIGGALGGLIGMYTFRHKTKHNLFRISLPILAIIQILIIVKVCS